MMRKILRRLTRIFLKHSFPIVKRLAVRLPFSRLHKIVSWIFWGEEIIKWRNVFIKVNPGEVHGYYPYFLGDYSPDEITRIIEFCKYANLFADIGANVGMISLAVAVSCPNLEVFAFEPDTKAIQRFYYNLNLNQNLASRVHIVDKCVADINGELLFQPSLDMSNPETGRLITKKIQSTNSYIVSSVRLDTFFERIGKYPDVVKIDVEGAELCVIKGMSGLFNKGFPMAMLIEVHPGYFNHEVSTFKVSIKTILEEAGYVLLCFNGRNCEQLPALENWPDRLHIIAMRKDKYSDEEKNLYRNT